MKRISLLMLLVAVTYALIAGCSSSPVARNIPPFFEVVSHAQCWLVGNESDTTMKVGGVESAELCIVGIRDDTGNGDSPKTPVVDCFSFTTNKNVNALYQPSWTPPNNFASTYAYMYLHAVGDPTESGDRGDEFRIAGFVGDCGKFN